MGMSRYYIQYLLHDTEKVLVLVTDSPMAEHSVKILNARIVSQQEAADEVEHGFVSQD